jgi:hypothetical protein
VYLFTRSGSTWSQQTYFKASNPDLGDGFGWGLALSADGATLAVGSATENSAATGIDGNQADNSATYAGAVYVFTRSGAMWSQQAYVKASNTDAFDLFGISLVLSADGDLLVVGANGESSASGSGQADNSRPMAGAAYVFARSGSTWSQAAFLKASNPDPDDRFGGSLAMTPDGTTLVAGANVESSAAVGIGGNQADNSVLAAGAVYRFTRSGTAWTQQAYIKASRAGQSNEFGYRLALSADGTILAAGAPFERSGATGIDGNQDDASALYAGAAYVFQ